MFDSFSFGGWLSEGCYLCQVSENMSTALLPVARLFVCWSAVCVASVSSQNTLLTEGSEGAARLTSFGVANATTNNCSHPTPQTTESFSPSRILGRL